MVYLILYEKQQQIIPNHAMTIDLHKDDELETKQLDLHLICRLGRYLRSQFWYLFLVLVFLLIITGIELTTVWIMGEALNNYIRPFDDAYDGPVTLTREMARNGLIQTVFYVVGLYCVQAVLTYAQMTLLVNAGQRIISDLRMDLFQHVQKIPALFYDRTPTGKVVTRLTNDVNNIHEAFSGVIVYLLKDIFMMVGILIMMLSVSWKLGLILLLPLPLIVISSLIFRTLNYKAYAKARETLSRLNSFMHECFSGIETIKVFVQEHKQVDKFTRMNQDGYKANIQSILVGSIFIPLVGFFVTLPTALLLWYGGFQILAGVITLGTFFMMISYLRMFYEPIADFSQKYILMQSAMASAERIFQLMDTPVDAQKNEQNNVLPTQIKGKIEFRNVCFSYDKKRPILKDISFVLESGQTLALVGGTGSGKTTITALLCRFYEIDSGMILVDDIDISTLPLQELRKHIAIIMQDPFIFSRSLLENITLNTPEITREDAEKAACVIGADFFINQLPQKYDTHLNERGSNLSAGQRQLLSFTRALAHNRSIMILDEATASIDSATEHIVQKATLTLLENRTSIVVAHRLSTIRHAHHILVLKQGEIIESGNHESLVLANGTYAEMVFEQLTAIT